MNLVAKLRTHRDRMYVYVPLADPNVLADWQAQGVYVYADACGVKLPKERYNAIKDKLNTISLQYVEETKQLIAEELSSLVYEVHIRRGTDTEPWSAWVTPAVEVMHPYQYIRLTSRIRDIWESRMCHNWHVAATYKVAEEEMRNASEAMQVAETAAADS